MRIEEARRKLREFDRDLELSKTSIREYERFVFRYLALSRRLGLPDDVNQAIARIHQLISVMRMLRVSAYALQAASGPIGWATALGGIAISGIMAADLFTEVTAY